MRLLNIVQNFTCAAGAMNDLNHLLDALAQASFDMGFGYFALSQHVDAGQRTVPDLRLHNYPARWEDFYDRNQFFRSDPIHRASQLTNMGFEWSAIPGMLALTKQDHHVLERGRAHGLAVG